MREWWVKHRARREARREAETVASLIQHEENLYRSIAAGDRYFGSDWVPSWYIEERDARNVCLFK